MTGHDGTTPWEILLVSAAAPLGIWLFQSLRALEAYVVGVDVDVDDDTTTNRSSYSKKATPTTVMVLVVEALVFWLPFLICQTNLLYPWGIILLYSQIQISVLISVYFWTTKRWMRLRNIDGADSFTSSNQFRI